MYCNHCGAVIDAGASVCPACGRVVTAAPGTTTPVPGSPAPNLPAGAKSYGRAATQRLAGHVHLLAIFWFVVAFLWLIPAAVVFGIGTAARYAIPADQPGEQIARALGPLVLHTVGFFLFLIAVLCFLAAWGLLKLRPWARGLVIVLGIISLFHPPLGTALGIYTLWVLLGGTAGADYETLAASAG